MSLFALTLRNLMNRKNIPEDELAEALEISGEMLYNLLHGYIEPSEGLLVKVAKYFDLPSSYLTGVPDGLNVCKSNSKYGGGTCNIIIPVVKESRITSPLIKGADIVTTVNLTVPEVFDNNEYIGILIEHDTDIGRCILKSGDSVMVGVTNQISNGETVAYSRLGGAVEFRRYTRVGPTITLYSFGKEIPVSFRVGSPEHKIIGPVRYSKIRL